jgi:hypothetical protein
MFSLGVEAIAKGARGDSQQAALAVIARPRKQRRELSQQLFQALDVVVVDDAPSLRRRPLQTLAKAFAHLGRQVLPAGVAILTREHKLGFALRQGQVNVWQLDPRTCDGRRVTGGNVARELLCLFVEG